MSISRRKFLGAAAGTAAALLPFKGRIGAGRGDARHGDSPPDCTLLDLQAHCSLPESAAGYEAALAEAGVHFVKTAPGLPAPRRTVIVPGCTTVHPSVARELATSLEDGICLLLESGAGFGDPVEFSAHRKLLQFYFGLAVESPVNLWGSEVGEGFPTSRLHRHRSPKEPRGLAYQKAEGHRHVPYVDYVWPIQTKIRDFSRVIPLSPQARDVVGWVEGLPIASKRRVGKGTLVYLGSPLGPSLLAGDNEARRWLRELLAVASNSLRPEGRMPCAPTPRQAYFL